MRVLPNILFVFFLLSLAATATPFEEDCLRLEKQKQPSVRLARLLDRYWKYQMEEFPEFATSVGYPGQHSGWTERSLKAIERRKKELEAPWKVVSGIDRGRLSPSEQLNFDLLKRDLAQARESRKYPGEWLSVSQMAGIQTEIPMTLVLMPRSTAVEYETILKRMQGIPSQVDQTMALLRQGVQSGITYPQVAMQRVATQLDGLLEKDPLKNALLEPFRSFPSSMKKGDQDRLRNSAGALLEESLLPSFTRLRDYFVQEYLPACRTETAWSSLKQGQAWYAFKVRESTTTSLTPETIHKIGLEQVKRIRQAMETTKQRAGFTGSLEAFNEFLRTDRRFFFASKEELIAAYRDLAKQIDPELPKLFGKLPRLTYGVVSIPDYAAPSQPTAYYQPGSPEAGRAGNFFANTFDLNSRPKWEMAALTLHEAVPGHHLQVALAQEMEGVPEFRKNGLYNAFVEGWGLYAESLGTEIGVYSDPYMDYGRLTYEMWRSIRLVVDTGMHALGWDRKRAIDFFKQYAGKAEHDIEVEVDRYLVFPGQALGYKIGQLRIQGLRHRAEEKLGAQFVQRDFHDAVLENGALPLDILEEKINAWIEKRQVSARRLTGEKPQPKGQNRKHQSPEQTE